MQKVNFAYVLRYIYLYIGRFLLTKLVVLLTFLILRHNDVIMIYIKNMISDLRSEYQN